MAARWLHASLWFVVIRNPCRRARTAPCQSRATPQISPLVWSPIYQFCFLCTINFATVSALFTNINISIRINSAVLFFLYGELLNVTLFNRHSIPFLLRLFRIISFFFHLSSFSFSTSFSFCILKIGGDHGTTQPHTRNHTHNLSLSLALSLSLSLSLFFSLSLSLSFSNNICYPMTLSKPMSG